MIKVFIDGASRKNPGHAGIGYLIKNGEIIISSGSKYIGIATNNVAEYMALYYSSLELNEYEDIEIFSDSLLLVNQMKGIYRIKNEELGKIKRKIRLPENTIFTHIPRRLNKEADGLANRAIDDHFRKN